MVDFVRNVNLIEVLEEDHEDVPEIPEEAAATWTEEEIRAYFSSGGSALPAPKQKDTSDAWLEMVKNLRLSSGSPVAVREGGWGMGSPLKPVGKAAAAGETKKARVVLLNWTGNRGGAGSAHSFATWAPKMPFAQVLEYAMPGRGTRQKEPCVENMQEHVQTLVKEIAALHANDKLPLILFGFSFGGIIAFETALELQRAHPGCSPVALVVASAEAPAWSGRGGSTKDMPMDKFEDLLRAKGGTDVIINDPGMKAMYMPVIKADMHLEESYTPSDGCLEATAVIAFHGERTNTVSAETAAGWMDITSVGPPYSKVVALRTELAPTPQAKWLDDWYLCQDKGTRSTIAETLAALLELA